MRTGQRDVQTVCSRGPETLTNRDGLENQKLDTLFDFFFFFYPLSDTFHINSSVSYDFSCSPEFCPLDKTHLCATVFIQIQKKQVFTHVFNQFKC